VTEASDVGSALQVKIDIPLGWWELPVTSTDLHADIAAIVDRRLAFAPETALSRDDIVELLQSAARQAARAGAVFAAQIGIEDVESFSASILLAIRRVPGLTPEHEVDQLELLVRHLAGPDGDRLTDEVVDRVTLGSLREGVRHRAIRELSDGLRIAMVRYYFPVEATPFVAIVNATSPNATAMSDLVEIFDDIVATILILPATPHLDA
jgi:hypothetical protein